MPELMEKFMIYPAGHHASGKTELCDYLTEQHGFRVIETGAMMRHLYHEREKEYASLDIKSYVARKLNEDKDYFDNELEARLKVAESQGDRIVVNGMRTYGNIEKLKISRPGFTHNIVWLDAPVDLLYDRYLKREGNQLTFDQFRELLQLDLELGLDEIKDNADFVIENVGDISDLRRDFDAILPQLGRKAIELSE